MYIMIGPGICITLNIICIRLLVGSANYVKKGNAKTNIQLCKFSPFPGSILQSHLLVTVPFPRIFWIRHHIKSARMKYKESHMCECPIGAIPISDNLALLRVRLYALMGEGDRLYVSIDIRTADACIIPQVSTYICCDYFSANAPGWYIKLGLILHGRYNMYFMVYLRQVKRSKYRRVKNSRELKEETGCLLAWEEACTII